MCELLQAEVPDGSLLEEYRTALHFIIIAWNISLLDADTRAKKLQNLATSIAGVGETEQRVRLLAAVERLIASKLALFPHNHRCVVSRAVRFQGDEVRSRLPH